MPVVVSRSVQETEALGERLGRSARRGDVFGLSGDLGAGKTALVRGFARALHCAGRVHSPTFSLLNEYAGGQQPLFHLDLYRLDGPTEVYGAGLEEYLVQPAGISVVEWIERWIDPALPEAPSIRRILIRIRDDESREITHDHPGS